MLVLKNPLLAVTVKTRDHMVRTYLCTAPDPRLAKMAVAIAVVNFILTGVKKLY
jgi:hypothetical protein